MAVDGVVTLYTGEQVSSSSVEWMRECEARQVLLLDEKERTKVFLSVSKIRGESAADALRQRVIDIEPHYVVCLPDRELRAAYLERFAKNNSTIATKKLEDAVCALWRSRTKNKRVE